MAERRPQREIHEDTANHACLRSTLQESYHLGLRASPVASQFAESQYCVSPTTLGGTFQPTSAQYLGTTPPRCQIKTSNINLWIYKDN